MAHWALAFFMVNDLATRQRVLGGRKLPWALLILFVAVAGSVIYFLCHPAILNRRDHDDER